MEALTEKRTWPRKDCLVPAFFHINHDNDNIDAFITDISGGGMRLRSSKEIETGTSVTVGFNLQGFHLIVDALIRWCDEKILGLQFESPVSPDVEKNIFTFVNAP